jgi:hypothetical protein
MLIWTWISKVCQTSFILVVLSYYHFFFVVVKVVNASVQPETEAMIKWLTSLPFSLSVQFQAGFEVVSYPFTTAPPTGETHVTRDDPILQFLARTYAEHHPSFAQGKPQCVDGGERYFQGIANGAVLQPKANTLQVDLSLFQFIRIVRIVPTCVLNSLVPLHV